MGSFSRLWERGTGEGAAVNLLKCLRREKSDQLAQMVEMKRLKRVGTIKRSMTWLQDRKRVAHPFGEPFNRGYEGSQNVHLICPSRFI